MRYWCGYVSGARCRLFEHGPADGTASQYSITSSLIEIQTGFTLLVPRLTEVVLEKRRVLLLPDVRRVCVGVGCACSCLTSLARCRSTTFCCSSQCPVKCSTSCQSSWRPATTSPRTPYPPLTVRQVIIIIIIIISQFLNSLGNISTKGKKIIIIIVRERQ